MTTQSTHRHWHSKRRAALFTDTPDTQHGGVLVFSTVPIDTAAAQQLAGSCTDGVAYVDGHHAVVRGAGGVYVTEAAQWFTQALVTQAGAEHCARVWQWLERAVQHHWRDEQVTLLATPGSTGRDLWLRTIPTGKAYATLEPELQQLLRSSAHQARVEVLPEPAAVRANGGQLAQLVEYDLRLAYMAVARNMPAGRPVWRHDVKVTSSSSELQQAGRWWVDFTPPARWQLPGIFPVMRTDGGWHYPTSGTHSTVVDGCELQLALEHGWQVRVQRALLWPDRCDPYRALFGRLLCILEDAQRHSELTQRMVRSAVRAMALHTIGAMHGAPHKVSRHGTAADVPADAQQLRIEADGTARWVQLEPGSWQQTHHPEWTAHLWARARYRVMWSPGDAGILCAPAGTVVAVRTDAVYLTQPMGWDRNDDGKPGRWVMKRNTQGPISWPRSHSELLRVRDGGSHGA